MNMMLGKLRALIDAVDERIVELLNERAALSLMVGKNKGGIGPVHRPGRESELLRALKKKNNGPLPDGYLEAVYREILSASRALQRREVVLCHAPPACMPDTVGGDGADGAAGSGEAATTFFNARLAGQMLLGRGNEYRLSASLPDVFQAVEAGRADMGVILLESSGYGLIAESAELLAAHTLFIRGEFFETAGAYGESAGSENSAGAKDRQAHWMRFVLIGKEPADRPGPDKSTVFFTVNGQAALAEVLQVFTCFMENAPELHSVRVGDKPGRHGYMADFACDILDERFAPVLAEAAKQCVTFKVVGSYPAGVL